MTITLSALQKQRYDTSANWTAENPTLLAGEIGVESDTGKIKIGTGSTAWTSLTYSGLIPGSGVYPYSQLLMPLGSAGAPSVSFNGDPNTGIYSPGANQVAVATNGVGRLFVDSAGLVGIGTIAPSTRFHLSGTSSSAVARIASTDSGATTFDGSGAGLELTCGGANTTNKYTPAIKFGSTDGDFTTTNPKFGAAITAEASETYNDDTDGGMSLAFWTTPNNPGTGSGLEQRLTIRNSGNVGIGTSAPSSRLHVVSNVQFDPADSNATAGLIIQNSGGTVGSGAYSTALVLSQVNSTRPGAAIASVQTSSDPDQLGLAFCTHGASSSSDVTAERLRIDHLGNVGIGTTSPLDPLHVLGPDGSGGSPSLSSNNIALFQNDGNTTDSAIITVVAGTAATAQISLGDVDDGNIGAIKYNNSSDLMEFATNNSNAVAIDSSGRLLVGTSTGYLTSTSTVTQPLFQVHNTSANAAQVSINSWSTGTSTGGSLTFCRSDSGTVGTHTVVGVADVLGNVRFAGSDGTKFIEGASITASADGTWGADDGPTKLVFSTTADGASSATERMRISSDGVTLFAGRVAFPNTNAITALSEAKSIFLHSNSGTTTGPVAFESQAVNTDTRYHAVYGNGNGIVGSISTSGSATSFTTSSDYRLKENVIPVSDGITRLQQLKPSRFNFIADPGKTVDGFIAHEVQTIVPEAITGEKDAVDDDGNPQYQGIDQSKLVPLLTAALQEAIAKIESLEARLTAAGI